MMVHFVSGFWVHSAIVIDCHQNPSGIYTNSMLQYVICIRYRLQSYQVYILQRRKMLHQSISCEQNWVQSQARLKTRSPTQMHLGMLARKHFLGSGWHPVHIVYVLFAHLCWCRILWCGHGKINNHWLLKWLWPGGGMNPDTILVIPNPNSLSSWLAEPTKVTNPLKNIIT